jgi:vesicle-associated membrane protein 7
MLSEISYALVACGNVVLAEESAVSGNANLVARKIAEKVPPGNTRVSYAQEGQLFHVLVAEGITFLCMADEPLGRRLPFAFLEDVRQRFLDEHGSGAHSAEAFSLNDAFAPVLAQRMDFFSHDPSADAINRTRNAVADVKNIMVENIEKVLERGERIELLVHKTDALQGQAFSFRRETRRLKNQMWWQKVKLTVTIVAVLLIIVYAIIAFTCSPTFHC